MTISTIKQHRLFYAVWPDAATSERLLQVQAPLHGRKTHRDDFHITLVFLGKRSSDLLPIFQEILMRLPSIEMTLVIDSLGYSRRNRIVRLGMKTPPPALFELQSELTRELTRRNIALDDPLAFKPHITLARNADAPGELPFDPIIWHARKIVLVESLIAAEGAKYRVLASR